MLQKLDAAGRREVRTLEQTHRSIAGVGGIERAGRRMVSDSLRLAQPAEQAKDLALFQVDDAHAVIAEFGHEQELPIGVEGEMIDAARHGTQRDFRLEHQRRRIFRPARRRQQHADQGCQHRHAHHCRLLANGPAVDGKLAQAGGLLLDVRHIEGGPGAAEGQCEPAWLFVWLGYKACRGSQQHSLRQGSSAQSFHDVRAVHFAFSADDAQEIRAEWRHHGPRIPLEIVDATHGGEGAEYLARLALGLLQRVRIFLLRHDAAGA